MNKYFKKTCGSRGQALVETALTLPLFLVLVFAVIDFGRVFYVWHGTWRAAQVSAETAAALPANSLADAIRLAATNKANSLLPLYGIAAGSLPITVTIPPLANRNTTPVTVQIAPTYNSVSGFFPFLTSLPLNVTGSAYMAPTYIAPEASPVGCPGVSWSGNLGAACVE